MENENEIFVLEELASNDRTGRGASNDVAELPRFVPMEEYAGQFSLGDKAIDDDKFHALVNWRNTVHRGVGARTIPYSFVLKQLQEHKVDFISELVMISQCVKPFLCFKTSAPAELPFFQRIANLISEVCPVFSSDMNNVVILAMSRAALSSRADEYEYRMIWNVRQHFANLFSLKTYLQPFERQMEELYIDRQAYKLTNDFLILGSAYRYEWKLEASFYGSRNSPAFRIFYPDDFDLDENTLKAFFITALQPDSQLFGMEAPIRRDFRPVPVTKNPIFLKVLDLVRVWNPTAVIDGDPIFLRDSRRHQLNFTVPGFYGMKCRYKEHAQRRLRAYIGNDRIAHFECCGNDSDVCKDFSVALDDEAEKMRRWNETFKFITSHNLDIITFPLRLETWGGHNLSARDFFKQFPEFDFDNDFGEHPLNRVEGSLPWNMDIVKKFCKEDSLDTLVRYMNLFLIIDISTGKIILRNLSAPFYQPLQEHTMKKTTCADIKYTVQEFTPGGKPKPLKSLFFWDYYKESGLSRKTTGFNYDVFTAPRNLGELRPNIMPPSRVDLNKAIAAWRALSNADKDWLRVIWDRLVHCVTILELAEYLAAAQDFFKRWFTRTLFCVGELFMVMVGIFSTEGGTGKSSIAEFIKKKLGSDLVFNTSLVKLMGTHFGSEFNVPFINIDDKGQAPDRKKNELLVGQIKNFITEPKYTSAAKYASEKIQTKKVANIYVTTNESFLGINSQGKERRFFLQEMLGEEAQNQYFEGVGKYVCKHCPKQPCFHNFDSKEVFWKQIIHNDIINSDQADIDGQFFLEFIGFLYLDVHVPLTLGDPTSLHLLLPPTRLVEETQSNLTPLEILWYNSCVNKGFIVNCNNLRRFSEIVLCCKNTKRMMKNDEKKDVIVEPDIDPNIIGTEWMGYMPIEMLWKDFNMWAKEEPYYRPSRHLFSSKILSLMQKRSNEIISIEMRDCHLFTAEDGVWRQRGGAISMECLRVFATEEAKASNAKYIKIDRSFRKSTSNAAFGENSLDMRPPSLSISPQIVEDAYLKQSDGFEENEDGDGIADRGDKIDPMEERSVSEEAGSSDNDFIAPSDDEVEIAEERPIHPRKRGREVLTQAQDSFDSRSDVAIYESGECWKCGNVTKHYVWDHRKNKVFMHKQSHGNCDY